MSCLVDVVSDRSLRSDSIHGPVRRDEDKTRARGTRTLDLRLIRPPLSPPELSPSDLKKDEARIRTGKRERSA